MNFRSALTCATLLAAAGCASMQRKHDPREGLKAGLTDAGQAAGNLKVVAEVPSPKDYLSAGPIDFTRINSDLTFTGQYAIQGNFNGFQIWDMSTPSKPTIAATFMCPASQNDVSVYHNLLFMSSEGTSSRLDCTAAGITDTVSKERVRGIRIFDISNIREPKLITSVQTCRGSHTHTVVEDPKDKENVYIYVSGSAGLRSPTELPGCVTTDPKNDPNSALWRIEIIKVPVNNPAAAAVINRANIFSDLKVTPSHGPAEADLAMGKHIADSARKAGGIVVKNLLGNDAVLGGFFLRAQLDSIVKARGGSGKPTAADTATFRANAQAIYTRILQASAPVAGVTPIATNRQCHDITVYPSVGLAGGACEGHGILLDISDVANPKRLDAAADSNFAYWHSATFNNDGTKVLFSDEWGGGTQPKCRATDKKEWGADAIFDIKDRKLQFGSYYKISAVQTDKENCVAHNGSLIPIPGRDVMVQAWYQGGVSVFDFTDTKHPKEIAYFDRGPIDSTRLTLGGSWSAYWYNGTLISSEIARGLDAFEMVPSEYVTQNEIDAANTVKLPYLNAQGQPKFNWPPSFPLAKAYVDQLERNKCLSKGRIAAVRGEIAKAESATGSARQNTLTALASSLDADAKSSCDAPKVMKLQQALTDLSHPIVP
ncbi:MAG TPA: hypothetical protein VF483_01295 [Gemmatimonadaceae bacterium]